MSLTKGLVFSERPHIGNTAPTTFEDTSRDPVTVTDTAIVYTKEASGIYTSTYNGSTSLHNLGSPSKLKVADFTLVVWVNMTSPVGYSQIINTAGSDVTNSFRMIVNQYTPRLTLGNSVTAINAVCSKHVALGKWSLLTGTIKGTAMTVFLNGEADGANIFVGNRQVTTVVTINNMIRQFNGKTGLVRIYNRALSPVEIADLFESERHWFGV